MTPSMDERAPTPLQPGQQVDNFKLISQVGVGASGEVWRAEDRLRTVALKFMKADLLHTDTADKHRARFRNEIQALERLIGLPRIPTLYSYNLYHARPYLVMAYIDAPPWSVGIQSGHIMRLTVTQRLNLLQSVAQTIHDMHRQGILHRDIKPSNIHGASSPYLIDFSIATVVSRAHLAETDVGTALYMPPSDGSPPDERHDNFGFALVAYELLFGLHAILSPAEMDEPFTRARHLMQHKLAENAWNLPSELSEAALPGSLRGADLEQIDALFTQALCERALSASELTEGLRTAIINPDNALHLGYVPSNFTAHTIPDEPHYTRHEVERARRHTYHPPPPSRPSQRWGRWGAIVLVILWVVALALVLVTVLSISA